MDSFLIPQDLPSLIQCLVLITLAGSLLFFQLIHTHDRTSGLLSLVCILTALSLHPTLTHQLVSLLALYIVLPFYIIFCHALYPMYRSKTAEFVFLGLSLFFISLTLTLSFVSSFNAPSQEIKQLLPPYLILTFIGFIYALHLAFQAIRHKRANSWLFLISLLCLPISTTLAFLTPLSKDIEMSWVSWGVVVFLCLNTGLLLSRFGYQLNHVQTLNRRLRKQIEHLQKTSQIQDDLLAETSHALKLPMSGIEALTGKLQQSNETFGKDVQESLALIKSSSNQLTHLLNDVLDYSSLKHHGLKLQLSTIEIEPMIQQVISNLTPMLSNRPVELSYLINHTTSGNTLNKVIADPTRLAQILYNLIGNAIKFTERGKIHVIVTREGKNHLRISVKDTGFGIDHHQATEIFKPYTQGVHESLTESGHGLGLTITQQLLTLHNSQLELKSIPGHGSTFSFRLEAANYIPDSIFNMIEGEQEE